MIHSSATRALAPLLLVVIAAALLPDAAAAQQLAGAAVGPDGEPLTGVAVVLHRVGGGGNALVDTDTTAEDGTFRFELEGDDSAVYFAALRYEGRIYIGPAAQGGGEPVTGYVLQVSPASEAGAVASALSGQAPPQPAARPAAQTRAAAGRSDTGAFLLVGLLALAAVGIFVVAAPRYRHRRTLDGVIELASVENALEDAEDEEERSRLRAARDRLRKQLAPRS